MIFLQGGPKFEVTPLGPPDMTGNQEDWDPFSDVSSVQGHPRSVILVPIESAYVT